MPACLYLTHRSWPYVLVPRVGASRRLRKHSFSPVFLVAFYSISSSRNFICFDRAENNHHTVCMVDFFFPVLLFLRSTVSSGVCICLFLWSLMFALSILYVSTALKRKRRWHSWKGELLYVICFFYNGFLSLHLAFSFEFVRSNKGPSIAFAFASCWKASICLQKSPN